MFDDHGTLLFYGFPLFSITRACLWCDSHFYMPILLKRMRCGAQNIDVSAHAHMHVPIKHSGDKLIGTQTDDGFWVRAPLEPSRYLTVSARGFDVYTGEWVATS